jgi:hypothetical protein
VPYTVLECRNRKPTNLSTCFVIVSHGVRVTGSDVITAEGVTCDAVQSEKCTDGSVQLHAYSLLVATRLILHP